MGLSLSLLFSTWNEILCHKFFGLTDPIETVIVRTFSYKKEEEYSETINKSNGSEKMIIESLMSFKRQDSKEADLEVSDSSKNTVPERDSSNSKSSLAKNHEIMQIKKPSTLLLPKPVILFSPRPVSELDAAATRLQKVYKSYRTRRNLADCAVVVEELCSVSFFNIEKPETALQRWARARTRVAKIDPRHRYGHNLHFYYDVWSDSKSTQPFFYWLDVGDGKDLNLERCLRTTEREAYEVIVESGKLVYRQTGMLINTVEGSKWIFVLSTSRALYVGQKKKGVFQHSSFLSGGATSAAGRLVAHDGVLEAIWPYSGHYLPTEDNFREFISFLEEHQVDLTNVKRCAIDDDSTSFKIIGEESKPEKVKVPSTTTISTNMNTSEVNEPINNISITADHQGSIDSNVTNAEAPLFDMGKPMACKWTSPHGPRIGCVRHYPIELQSQALEKVNLSPKLTPGNSRSRLPIPSPRPSPKIRVSPRLSNMGFPSPRPRVLVNTAN
ncbi:iq domain-containing protein iqm1 [Quercus suber]|uniref:Iq domain-containing protein iqm1 n=1 Tax=Quercus suber TaxID=58331 RepID=A0AAW0M8W0_QUESU